MGMNTFLMYVDDSSNLDVPEAETGEHGNHGILSVGAPNNNTNHLSYYFLGSNQPNVGQDYYNYTKNPVQISVSSQIIDPSDPPDISDVSSVPDPQEVEDFVNISAQVTDNLNELYSVSVQITDPLDLEVGNFTMIYKGADIYYYQQEYDLLGTYKFTIWASDNSANWNSHSGNFEITDTKSPEISAVTALPSSQGVGDLVNISGALSDVVEVYGAWVNIQDPNGGFVGNFSMDYNPDANRYYFVQAYGIVGEFSYTIWVNDTSNNWNSSQPGIFTILDTLSPTARAGDDQSVSEGTIVVLDAGTSTDNVGIVNHTWTFTEGTTPKTLYGESPSYRFENPGDFRIRLNVSDAMENWGIDIVWVNVTVIEVNGTISGIVTDGEGGGPIAGATVTLEGTSFEATTDGTGSYIIRNVPAGIYNITVSRDNFKDQTLENVVVVAGETTSDTQITMSKTQSTSDDEEGSISWLLLLVIIVVVLLLVLLMAKPEKETQREIVEEVVEEVHFLCPECGTMVDFSMNECPGCGAEFRDRDDLKPVEETPEPEESPADIYMCPSCGSFVSSHATTCEKCGFDFEEEKPKDDEDLEVPEIPAGFMGAPSKDDEDEVRDTKREPTIPEELTDKVVKEVEALMAENGFEIEELELELELETDGEADSKKELKDAYETLSKELEDILETPEDEKEKKSDSDSEEEEEE
jgi:hypothetical protein